MDLETRLKMLVDITERNDAALDALSETLAQIERALAELRFGVTVSVPMTGGQLTFRQEGKIWRLLFVADGRAQLLINSAKSHKIEAADHLPMLVLRLTEECQAQANVVVAATDQAKKTLELIRQFSKKPGA